MKRKLSSMLRFAAVAAILLWLAGCTVGASSPGSPSPCSPATPPATSATGVRVEIVVGHRIAVGVLEDSAAARDLAAHLPLTLELSDSFGFAKTGEVPFLLDATGAIVSCEFAAGEIGYSPAEQAIAIFHFHETGRRIDPGVARIGSIISGLEVIADGRSIVATIRRAT